MFPYFRAQIIPSSSTLWYKDSIFKSSYRPILVRRHIYKRMYEVNQNMQCAPLVWFYVQLRFLSKEWPSFNIRLCGTYPQAPSKLSPGLWDKRLCSIAINTPNYDSLFNKLGIGTRCVSPKRRFHEIFGVRLVTSDTSRSAASDIIWLTYANRHVPWQMN